MFFAPETNTCVVETYRDQMAKSRHRTIINLSSKDLLLFLQLRDLFSLQADMVFYFEEQGPPTLSAHHRKETQSRGSRSLRNRRVDRSQIRARRRHQHWQS